MGLFVEFHVIQNFAPSNLNRDDTGSPKDAIFGGHRRARVSSQCFKRAIRMAVAAAKALPEGAGSVRTKKLKQILESRLVAMGHEDTGGKVEAALSAAGLAVKDDGKTEYLLFLGRDEIESLARLIHEHWDGLGVVQDGGGKRSKKDAKTAGAAGFGKALAGLLDGRKAVDVALFGRMLADLPGVNQEAACQVAHAISTHRVEREFDYFTAVDDEGSADETGAGMIGQVEFNSATFYRYAVIDPAKLVENLHGDKDLAVTGIRAFAEAMTRAVPSGKQSSFAAYNPPAFVGVVVRHSSPFNLANAFEKPVWPRVDRELSAMSVEHLASYEGKIARTYGDGRDAWAYVDLTGAWTGVPGEAQESVGALSAWLERHVRAELEG